MINWRLLLLPLFLLSGVTSCIGKESPPLEMDTSTKNKVVKIVRNVVLPERLLPQGKRIQDISAEFLGTPYQADTLKGSAQEPEVLVADFNGVDCFTLLDYVQALSHSEDVADFSRQLAQVRYVDGKISFAGRKHFFTDWYATLPRNADDVTRTISPQAVTVEKQLNRKADGGEFIPGLGTLPRQVTYIPAGAIDQQVLDSLHNGDYIGIYTPLAGLDVTHTGIVIKQDGQVWYRNASSLYRNRKVADSPLQAYMANKPGIVVLRAR